MGLLAGAHMSFLLLGALIGYGVGRRQGQRQGFREGAACAPLELRRVGLEQGRCTICGCCADSGPEQAGAVPAGEQAVGGNTTAETTAGTEATGQVAHDPDLEARR